MSFPQDLESSAADYGWTIMKGICFRRNSGVLFDGVD
jgi:hypothetical protein